MSDTDNADVTETETEAAPHETNDQLPADHPLVKALAAQKSEIKELKAKARKLDELEEATKTETQRLAERADAEFNRAQQAETELLRYKVATDPKFNIPPNAMKFLTGTTREEIEASAKDVLELIGDAGKPRAPKPDPNQGRTSPTSAVSPATEFASLIQQQLNSQ